VRHEMLLLSNMLQLEDSLWEQRVRCGWLFSLILIDLVYFAVNSTDVV
jgi:hypothetical protein